MGRGVRGKRKQLQGPSYKYTGRPGERIKRNGDVKGKGMWWTTRLDRTQPRGHLLDGAAQNTDSTLAWAAHGGSVRMSYQM